MRTEILSDYAHNASKRVELLDPIVGEQCDGRVQLRSLSARSRNVYGCVGTLLLFLIIAVKLIRLFPGLNPAIVGIAPSLLGPPGLLFLILSDSGRFSSWTLHKAVIAVGVIMMLVG